MKPTKLKEGYTLEAGEHEKITDALALAATDALNVQEMLANAEPHVRLMLSNEERTFATLVNVIKVPTNEQGTAFIDAMEEAFKLLK